MLRLLFIVLLLPFGSHSQIDAFYGSYFIGSFNEEMQFVVPYNCWTENPDEVTINATGDSLIPLEVIFDSFHSEILMGTSLMAGDSSSTLQLFNPDAENVEARTYQLSLTSNGFVVLAEENTDTVFYLVRVEHDHLYILEQCPEEEETEE